MVRNPWDLEINARYTQRRVAELMTATRPLPTGGERSTAPHPTIGRLFVSIGRGLIAAGERLAGPTGPRRVPVRTTVGRPV